MSKFEIGIRTLTEWHLIHTKSNSVQSSLGNLSIRRTATHVVEGFAFTDGLHFMAKSWRKLKGKSEKEFSQMENMKKGLTVKLPYRQLQISLGATRL